jgi:hypothetical protein
MFYVEAATPSLRAKQSNTGAERARRLWIASFPPPLRISLQRKSSSDAIGRNAKISLQDLIDCLATIVRERNLNSRTTAKRSPPEAVRFAHP